VKGTVLARHERDFRTDAEAPLSLNELLALLDSGEAQGRTREDAIACYLSGSDGWRDAVKQLGGAFADQAVELRDRKGD
jgi:type IV secretory pathway VirJ component